MLLLAKLLRPRSLVTLVMLAVSNAHAGNVPLGQSGLWSLYVYMKDDGSYGHCGMKTGSSVGTETLDLTVSEAGFFVFLTDSHWELGTNDAYTAFVDIGGKTFTGKANVYFEHGVVMVFPFDTGFGEALETGSVMNFKIGNFERSVDLQGAPAAITQLARCVQQYMPSRDPFGKGATSTDPFR